MGRSPKPRKGWRCRWPNSWCKSGRPSSGKNRPRHLRRRLGVFDAARGGPGADSFCASLPNAEWSDLNDGAVLVPMLQRLLQDGGRRFARASFLECGDAVTLGGERWTPVDTTAPKEIRLRAGVYRGGGRLVAVNRPAREDDREILEAAKAKALFGALPVQLFEEQRSGEGRAQSELWRLFLFGVAVFLIVEAVLILPGREERTDLKTPRRVAT